MPLVFRENPYTTLLIGFGCMTALLLSLELPFLYYSDDVVFHAAKMMAAKDGDFFTDPVTGFQSLYPPLFHIVWGTLARVFDLNSFQLSRVVQVAQYVGLLLSSFAFLRVVCGSRERAAWGTLCVILLMYAPTGKYWLVHNPFNTSLMFMLSGAALVMRFAHTGGRGTGMAGGLLVAIGANLWWWNLYAAAGLLFGLFVSVWQKNEVRSRLGSLLLVVCSFVLPLGFTAGVAYHLRALLPDYAGLTAYTSYAATHSLMDTVLTWIKVSLLKGNQQFFKYLYPAAWSSSSTMVRMYGLAATVYFYVVVLPFNYALVIVAVRASLAEWRSRAAGLHLPLFVASMTTFVLSFVTMFQTNWSITRRVQFYVVLFLLPVFVQVVWNRTATGSRLLLRRGLPVVGALALAFGVVYRSDLTITRPRTSATDAVAAFIDAIPGHAERRFFVTEYDNHLLLREVRYRSFLVSGNPTYFSQDKRRADSIDRAYQAIVGGGPAAARALREFQTEYAVIGKMAVNISPSQSTAMPNALAGPMLTYFRANGEVILENAEWAVFRLTPADESPGYRLPNRAD